MVLISAALCFFALFIKAGVSFSLGPSLSLSLPISLILNPLVITLSSHFFLCSIAKINNSNNMTMMQKLLKYR